jgi:hypothetical protein
MTISFGERRCCNRNLLPIFDMEKINLNEGGETAYEPSD